MKRQVDLKFATPFGIWLQNYKPFHSSNGYTRHDIDIIWHNYMSKNWMIIEEKCLGRPVEWSQKKIYDLLKKHIYGPSPGAEFKGFHELIFENTTPDDGSILWDGDEVTKEQLIEIFKM